ncbi:MAG: glycosyltransferase [Bacteroidota bacterium]|nr:glycosyltransferase [Bacteroidota bacterium]
MIALQIILFVSVFGILHSYLFFPLLLKWKAQGKSFDADTFTEKTNLPSVSIIIAAYNEEAVIEEKVNSIFQNDYPTDKIEVLIGSDNSTDSTNEICLSLSEKHNNLHFTSFKQRQGKIQIINKLEKQTKSPILIFTDANVIFGNNSIYELIKYFKNDDIGLIDSHMINTGLKKEGISFQEKSYISREVYIKHREGLLWGSMMGPFGGCYAIRKNLYQDVPINYLVDDFYICMNVLQHGKKCINNLNAKVYEDVPNNLGDEFRRKVRIATGDFQNLKHFSNLLWPPWNPIAFCFWSHKALRWLGPFFLILIIISLGVLAWYYNFYLILTIFTLFIFSLPLFDHLFKKFNIHNVILRFATHFFTMNLALFTGFIRTLKGVNTNVWQPTKRHQ